MRKSVRTFAAAGVAAGGLLLMAGPASAHIEPTEETVSAGSAAVLTLQVPHGCDTSPTRQLKVQIPEDVLSVVPQVHTGWDISAPTTKLTTPAKDEEGNPITERVTEVTFTAKPGNELSPQLRDTFSIGYTAPDKVGERLQFKTIQTCVKGETAWIEPNTGQGQEPEHPAPTVEVVKAESEGGDAAEAASTSSGTKSSSDTKSDDSDSSKGLAIGAIVVSILAIAASGFAVVSSRKGASSS
jgi:uncharacterized protein YcnI